VDSRAMLHIHEDLGASWIDSIFLFPWTGSAKALFNGAGHTTFWDSRSQGVHVLLCVLIGASALARAPAASRGDVLEDFRLDDTTQFLS
jgi:hypothetical protein